MMSVAVQKEGPTGLSTMTDVDQSTNSAAVNLMKYPHTRAILNIIASFAKSSDRDSLGVDQEVEDSRITPALISRVVTLLQEEKEDDLKVYLKEAFQIPDLVVCLFHFFRRRLLSHFVSGRMTPC